MARAADWKKPFEISIGELKVVEKRVKSFRRKISFNGEMLEVEPHEFRDFIEKLLDHSSPVFGGMEITNDSKLRTFLVKSKTAYPNPDGFFFATEEFKAASHEFLKHLCTP